MLQKCRPYFRKDGTFVPCKNQTIIPVLLQPSQQLFAELMEERGRREENSNPAPLATK
jgi:hypothetical protein